MAKVVGSVAVGQVVASMDQVRAGWSRDDGLGVFLDVYRRVTALVALRVTDATFGDPAFVEDLDVRFAGLFLEVPRDVAARRPVNRAWAPLVERRAVRGILPVQFALAGMNAHINHDLALAVVSTCEARGVHPTSPGIHADFERVNDVLAEVVRPIRRSFLDQHVVRAGAPLSPVADLVSNFSIDKARDAAWASALTLWAVRDMGFVADAARDALARTVGLVGRQLLIAV
ncbi:DUF5995 family protein [Cellulomonas rhizosphaerae]|uniref:Uncharacterized protein n=1 Tax=Cellulomonas rhizosphaerae TaxID=2293719 RepID=A0A413RN60_9CELL|nr:DUF5995 family protein [Cellulomonas rhizosphaerae]RHA42694.1 hypothetical protein D1825_06830 [Cellulomonas rhizosphaerae]